MTYILHLIIIFDIFTILCLSLNILTGHLGLFSLSHALFYGIGAYTVSLLMLKLGWPFIISLIFTVIVGGCFGFVLAKITSKARDADYILITLAVQVIGYSILINWTGLTNGPFGLSGIPRPVFGSNALTGSGLALFSTVLMGIIGLMLKMIQDSPFGRTLKAIRENELAATSFGVDANAFIRKSTILAGALAALAGSLYAIYATYIDPSSFSISESILFVLILVIGGSGNIKGPIIGALIVTLLPEALRFFNITANHAAEMRQVIFGMTIVLLMLLRPHGVAGAYRLE